MLTHYTRKKLEEESQAKEQQPQQETVIRQERPVQEDVEFAEEFTPQVEILEDSEQKSKRKKKGE